MTEAEAPHHIPWIRAATPALNLRRTTFKMNPVRQAASGWRRFAWLMLGAGFLLLGYGLLHALHRTKVEVLSCNAAATQPVRAESLLLTNCQLDLSDATPPPLIPGRRPPQLYVPVHGLGETGLAQVLLITKNPILMATYLQLQTFKSADEARAWASKHAEMVFPRRNVKGLVRAHPRDLLKIKWERPPQNLAATYLLLEEGAEPGTGSLRAGAIIAGLLLIIVAGFLMYGRKAG